MRVEEPGSGLACDRKDPQPWRLEERGMQVWRVMKVGWEAGGLQGLREGDMVRMGFSGLGDSERLGTGIERDSSSSSTFPQLPTPFADSP